MLQPRGTMAADPTINSGHQLHESRPQRDDQASQALNRVHKPIVSGLYASQQGIQSLQDSCRFSASRLRPAPCQIESAPRSGQAEAATSTMHANRPVRLVERNIRHNLIHFYVVNWLSAFR